MLPQMLMVVAGLWLALVFLLSLEALRHRWILQRIPVRIHVNGTRGKTSVTRLIAAGLRAGGKRVCAKTTGSAAALTDPDGREFPLYRLSGANIIEQMRIMGRMVTFRPEIAVMECMALQPQYQSLTELKMVRSTIGVITNARADHLEVMGPEEEDVALALAGSTPVKGELFTAERDLLPVFEHSTRDRGSDLHPVTLDEVEAIDEATLNRFRYSEHAENVALALKLCERLGVDRETALEGMVGLEPEPGAMRILHVRYFERDMIFVNAFAANDPQSTERIWEKMVSRHGQDRRRLVLINCRADRPHRSQQLAQAVPSWSAADRYILMGSGTLLFARMAVKAGLDPEKLIVAEQSSMVEITETILEQCNQKSLVVGVCNIHGGGEAVARFFQNRAMKEEDL
ncbi:poly-gamma-glutamate synthase PgsB/CapB [Natronospira proteinivora]|uniref:Poly-gamma-glutamate synthase PgsB/CapB n=1 Tax=Natronospira proteinivora TaxID=1807133 RepID=A0ABT1G6E2_9GAMM|nr:poly-gamma-glutamate synthase PgsB [Natronospira proteinivora]MCP1726860.1 poly-gamma-glutamate synthase PgsB/CapB [Natronospira proteinivora]